jgi:hypothetical protein
MYHSGKCHWANIIRAFAIWQNVIWANVIRENVIRAFVLSLNFMASDRMMLANGANSTENNDGMQKRVP